VYRTELSYTQAQKEREESTHTESTQRVHRESIDIEYTESAAQRCHTQLQLFEITRIRRMDRDRLLSRLRVIYSLSLPLLLLCYILSVSVLFVHVLFFLKLKKSGHYYQNLTNTLYKYKKYIFRT